MERIKHCFEPRKIITDAVVLLILILSLVVALYRGSWRDSANQDVSYRLEIALAGGFLIFAFLLWKILAFYLNANEYSERKDFVDLHAKILGSAALVISLLFTWQGIKNNQKTSTENQTLTLLSLKNAEKKQLDDRYNKALEQLGSEKREARVGAIYSLGKIAKDSIEFSKQNPESKDFYWEIIQTIAGYVRANAPATQKSTRSNKEIPQDIQAALSVLAWRSYSYQNGEAPRLDLFGTDLRGLILKDIENPQDNLLRMGAHFEGAQLYDVNFEESNLRGINLRDAVLSNAKFKNAYLAGADLTDADLSDANIEGADLGGSTKADIDQILSAMNWEKAKKLPFVVCKEMLEKKDLNLPKGCQ